MNSQAAHRVNQLTNELLKTRLGDLGNVGAIQAKIRQLQSSIGEVQAFVETMSKLAGPSAAPAPKRRGRPPKAAKAAAAKAAKAAKAAAAAAPKAAAAAY